MIQVRVSWCDPRRIPQFQSKTKHAKVIGSPVIVKYCLILSLHANQPIPELSGYNIHNPHLPVSEPGPPAPNQVLRCWDSDSRAFNRLQWTCVTLPWETGWSFVIHTPIGLTLSRKKPTNMGARWKMMVYHTCILMPFQEIWTHKCKQTCIKSALLKSLPPFNLVLVQKHCRQHKTGICGQRCNISAWFYRCHLPQTLGYLEVSSHLCSWRASVLFLLPLIHPLGKRNNAASRAQKKKPLMAENRVSPHHPQQNIDRNDWFVVGVVTPPQLLILYRC